MKYRSLIAAAVGSLVLAPLSAPSASAATGSVAEAATGAVTAVAAKPKPRPKVALKPSASVVLVGDALTLAAKKPGRALRGLTKKEQRKVTTTLERREGSGWVRVEVHKGRAKRVNFRTAVPETQQRSLSYRASLKLGKRKLATGSASVQVATQTMSATIASTLADAEVSWSVAITPARAGRTVRIEQYVDGGWASVGEPVAVDTAGQATVRTAALGHPSWLRVVAPAWQGQAALASAPARTTATRVPTMVAHRAGAGVAPEQTLAAVRAAVASGAPAMEIDVQLTSDQQPVIVHDADFRRTTNVEDVFPTRAADPVGSFSLAEVKQLDAGSWFGAQFAGERIPTLDEVIDEMGTSARLVLEVKSPEVAGNDQIDEVLTAQLATGKLGQLAAQKRLSVSSFGLDWLQAFATLHTDVPVGALTTTSPTPAQLDAWQPWAEEVHANVFFISKAAVDAAHQRSMTVSVWTANTPSAFRRSFTIGADSIITDHTAMLAQVLAPAAPPAG